MVTVGNTKYEDTDLNDAKEGRYRRQLMYQHDRQLERFYPYLVQDAQHFWDKSLNTKINDSRKRWESKLTIDKGKRRG